MTLNVAKFDFSKFGQKCPKIFSMQFFVISRVLALKFRYFEKAKEFCEIFTLDLTVCIKRQIQSGDFAKFCGLLTSTLLCEVFIKFWWPDEKFIFKGHGNSWIQLHQEKHRTTSKVQIFWEGHKNLALLPLFSSFIT